MRGRVARRVAVVLLAAPLIGLAGCAEEAPSDASREDFCAAFNSLADASTGEDFRAFAERLDEAGTPGDISRDGRAGFEVVVRVARSLESDASLEELQDPNVSDREEQQAQAFLEYGSETCTSLDDESGAL